MKLPVFDTVQLKNTTKTLKKFPMAVFHFLNSIRKNMNAFFICNLVIFLSMLCKKFFGFFLLRPNCTHQHSNSVPDISNEFFGVHIEPWLS